MKKLPVENIKTDVLVIGGGAAGLTAALEARAMGANVTIVSKSKVGRSGNTIISGSSMAILMPDTDSKDTADIFRSDTIRSGKGINDPNMVDLFLTGSPKVIDKLLHWGVILKKLGDRYMIKHNPGHSKARQFSSDFSNYPYLTRGLSLTIPLLNTARKSGIQIIDYAPVVKLLVSEGRISGAAAISKKMETVLIFQSPVVILAAGGGGRVYARSNNTVDVTGDSYSLAYDAGAMLRDMEFVQFYPNMMFTPIKVSISTSLYGEGAFLQNNQGDRFMEKYDTAGDMATRDVMTRAIFNEIAAGKGNLGNVFIDCRHLARETLTAKFGDLVHLLSRVNIDPSKDLIPVSPATHFFMGGIATNKRCETTIPGLLACGESVGGLHGANRLAGNALAETFIFGMIAGNHAARYSEAESVSENPKFDIAPFRPGTLSVSEPRRTLRESTWKFLSIIRERQSAEQTISTIEEISASLDTIGIETVHDLVAYYELKSMVTTARLVATGAIHRTESRGAHFRSDYPDTDDESLKGNFYFENRNGRLDIRFIPIDS